MTGTRLNSVRSYSIPMFPRHRYGASFLSVGSGGQISNGSMIEINETGTRMRLVPGLLVGGANLEHDCHTSRSIGYYLEALASLAPFAKHATEITLRGVTNDDRDPSVCVGLPLVEQI